MKNESAVLLQASPTGMGQAPQQIKLEPHLLSLPDTRWAVWRDIAVRSAGFPAAQVLKLAVPQQALALEEQLRRLEHAQDEARKKQAKAVMAADSWVNHLRPDQRAGPAKILTRLQNGKLPRSQTQGLEAAVARDVEALRGAQQEVENARTEFHRIFEAALQEVTTALSEIASSEPFSEAVIWQNRRVHETALQPYVHHSGGGTRGFKQRQREELIATYWQRYCVKNDTIGFFGPVGWAKVIAQADLIDTRPGPRLLATRQVRFEGWCIDTFVAALLRDQSFEPWLVPRRQSLIDIDGLLLHLPLEPPIKVSPEYAALLKACQGEQTAKQIARQLLQDSRLGFKNEAAIYRMLQDLRDRRLISWEWVIPIPEQTKPEEPLTRMLARIEDEQLRQKSLSLLNELNEARKNVARASGDPQKLACSLADLDATFTRMTGAAPTRSAGHMYAARTLVYEDCRRDIEVTISPEMIHSLGPALTLLLDGARWVSYEFAARARQVFEKIYTDLTRKSGSPVVEAVAFYEKLRPLVFSGESAIHKTVLKDFYKRWSQILQVDSKERQVSLSSVELRPRVLSAFAAPRAGWPYARFHSPDLMIAAASPAAIRRGDYLFVLGELHPGGISISNGIFVDQHPVPQELFQALERDLPESRVLFIAPKHQPGANARTSLCLINPHDYFLDYSLDSAHFAPQSTLALGNIVFERHNAKLMARTRDGRVAFDAVEFLGFLLTTLSGADLKIAPPARHTPRICIDRLCVTRESWLFSPAEVSFVEEKDEAFRFLAARRWAQDRGMPRFVFVKTPAEVKPFFVDFDSPVLINVFTKMVRRVLSDNHTDPLISMPANPLITVSEMLPTPEQLWLTDAEGQFYTSELRMVAVDLLDKANRHGTDAASDSLTS